MASPSLASLAESMPSPDDGPGSLAPARRKSVFGRRSRSKTVSSQTTTASTISVDDPSPRRLSRDEHSISGSTFWASDQQPEPARSFFSRNGKRLRRHTSKLSLSSMTPSSEDVEESAGWKTHQQGVGRRRRETEDRGFGRRRKSNASRKRNISEPFDFQHITHTSPNQFPKLDTFSRNELANEFSAARAAQIPQRELRGIKAEDLSRGSSSDALSQYPRDTPTPNSMSPPVSPRGSRHLMKRSQSNVDLVGSTLADGADAVPNGPSAPRRLGSPITSRSPRLSGSTVIPPPRKSSMAAVTVSWDKGSPTQPSLLVDPARAMTGAGFRHPVALDPFISTPQPDMSVVPEAPLPESIPHAVTTPDDTAWPLKAPVPGSQVAELADVVEEDEDGYSKGTSLPLSELWSTSSALRLTRSVPNLKALRNGSTASPMANADPMSEERPRSQMSDTLGGPFCQSPVKGAAGVPGSSKILSEGTRVVESCWEDDIDYCYEHAAEADFDYRWETYSNGDGQTTRAQGQDLDSLEMSRQPAFASLREMRGFDAMPRSDSPDIDVAHGAIFPSQRNVPPAVHVPSDLDGGVVEPSPAASFSTYASEAITPSDSVVPTQSSGIRTGSYDSAFEEQDDMIRHPSLILSRGFDAQNLQDCMYEELLANDGKIGTQYALYDGPIAPRASVSESLRSDTSLSKCNSQSSMVLQGGGAAAAGTARGTAAQRHLSVNSAGSLPELVHSRTRRDEFDAVAGQLAEQIAALKVVDEMQHAGPSIPAVRRCRVGPNVAGRLEAAQKGASAEGAALRRSNMGRGRAHSEAGLTVISAVAVPEGPSSSTNRMRSTSLVEGQAGLAS